MEKLSDVILLRVLLILGLKDGGIAIKMPNMPNIPKSPQQLFQTLQQDFNMNVNFQLKKLGINRQDASKSK